MNKEIYKATFGAGCFWGVQEAFDKLEGVTDTAVGFMGGDVEHPSYKQVCAGGTGHIEVVQMEYDPDVVSCDDLLDVFFDIHDPTQVNRQGPDVGRQYASVIFYHTDAQRTKAHAKKEAIAGDYDDPIATEIRPASDFWRAEEYHQHYIRKTGKKAC